jgi:hypothetical protein
LNGVLGKLARSFLFFYLFILYFLIFIYLFILSFLFFIYLFIYFEFSPNPAGSGKPDGSGKIHKFVLEITRRVDF